MNGSGNFGSRPWRREPTADAVSMGDFETWRNQNWGFSPWVPRGHMTAATYAAAGMDISEAADLAKSVLFDIYRLP